MNKTAGQARPFPLWLYALSLAALMALAYLRVFSAGFISWDDPELVLNNRDVHQLSLKAFFSGSYTGNYMPLTMLAYGLDWLAFHAAPRGYHLVNILLHGLNALLALLLSYRLFNNRWKALACAVVFCLHPLQVESVAWVAEAKTLLFSFFLLWGLLAYVRYLDTRKALLLYGPVMLLFVLSLLSKPAAVCFPLCLLCIDLIYGRAVDRKAWLEKIPFFMLSLAFGIVAIFTQQHDRYINTSHAFEWYQRLGYAGYALLCYLGGFVAPVKQSVIYPYPQNTGTAMALGVIGLLALAAAVYLLWSRKKFKTAGIVFFVLANLVLVLQFVPFGETLTADRYMYLPLLGLAWLLFGVLPWKENMLKGVIVALALVLGLLTFNRSRVWENSIELYSDIIKKYPDSYVALNSLGAEHMLYGNTQLAYKYLDKAISSSPEYYKGYYNRGLLNFKANHPEEAIRDFTKAIELKQYVKAYVGRGNAYYRQKDLSRAMADANEALRLEPSNARAAFLLANCYDDLNQLDKALYYYNACISASPEESIFYMRRAIVYGKQQNFQACLHDLDTCIGLKPDEAEPYYWRGVAKVNLRQSPCNDFRKAYENGFPEAEGALAKYCR